MTTKPEVPNVGYSFLSGAPKQVEVKMVKSTIPIRSIDRVLISLTLSSYVDKILKKVTNGQCDAKPMVTFPTENIAACDQC